jgi:hypothetical protein
VEDLPMGVTASPCVIPPGQLEGVLLLSAAPDCGEWMGELQIVGTARINDQSRRRSARGATLLASTANVESTRPMARLTRDNVLTLIAHETAPARVQLAAAEVDDPVWRTSLGGKLTIPVQYVKRGEVKGDLALTAIGLPSEIKGQTTTLKPDTLQTGLELSLESEKIPPGTYNFFLRGKVAVSYARNPQAIERAAAERKAFDEVVRQITEQAQQAATALAAAQQTVAAQVDQLKQANDLQQTIAQALDAAAQNIDQARQPITSLQQFASATPTMGPSVQQVDAATQQISAQLVATKESVEQLKSQLTAAQSQVETAQSEVAQAEQRHKELTEKQQRAAEHVKSLDQRLKEAQDNLGPKDVTTYMDSTAVTLQVLPSPVDITLASNAITLTAGQEQLIPVQLQRHFGFADVVTLELELPEGLTGVRGEPLTLAADQTTGMLKLAASAEAAAGQHTLQVKVDLKFNNVSIQSRLPITVELRAP